MLTTCTACGTQFRVSTTQLRSVHGLVRCSRCHSVFDAFETLREEFEAASPVSEVAAADELAELAQEISNLKNEKPPVIPARIAAHPVAAADLDIQPKEKQAPAGVDDLFAAVWGETPVSAPAEPISQPTETDTPWLIEDHIAKPPGLARDQALYKHVQLPPREHTAPKAKPQPIAINRWGVGVVVLALLLGIQVVNANRLALSNSPILGVPLTAIYSVMGHSLKANLTSSTWQVSNINVTSDPDTPGALSITGALQNSAGFAQSWPLLRVELTDRYGDPLRARDFTASAYLPTNQSATWLGAGMATHFRVDVVDPGPDAVGFQVQACIDVKGSRECGNSAVSD
ncbi:MAG: DUF3426 domain-containing protein [Gammaproteobacteria bacterium]